MNVQNCCTSYDDVCLEALFRNIHQGVIIADHKGEILMINPAGEKIFGFSSKELIGKQTKMLLPYKLSEISRYSTHFEGGDSIILSGIRQDGKEIPLKLSMSNCISFDKYFTIIILNSLTQKFKSEVQQSRLYEGIQDEIIERTRDLQKQNIDLQAELSRKSIKEAKLRKHNQELDKMNKELDMFVYSASHDLKMPVKNLNSLVQIIKTELGKHPSSVIVHVIEMLESSAKRLEGNVEDLIELVRIQKEEGRKVYDVNLKEVYTEVITSIKDFVEETNVKVSHNLSDNDSITFTKPALKSVLYNLLTNAVKYRSTEREAQVEVMFNKLEKGGELRIKDNGLGIKEEDQKNLFKSFKRFHYHVEGSGLGLFIIKNILNKYNAKVNVHSGFNLGTEFVISFR